MVYIENDVKRVLLFFQVFVLTGIEEESLLQKKSSMHSFLSDVWIDKRYFFSKILRKKRI